MADAQQEKLNLLREYRLSQERFYYNLSVISGGTLSLIVTLINFLRDIINGLGSCSRMFLWISIVSMVISFILGILRNLFSPASIKDLAQDEQIINYSQVISESLKEKWYVKVFSVCSILFYIVGLIIFILITMPAIL